MTIEIPELSLVLLVGLSGSGKSTFAAKHFKRTEVISSDVCRGLVSDDENDQGASTDAFALLHFLTGKRLAAGRLTVIDATNLQAESRKPLLAIARDFHTLPVAIVVETDERTCAARNKERPDRAFKPHVLRQQAAQLKRSIRELKSEGFRYIFRLRSSDDVDNAVVVRRPLWSNKKQLTGPFDIVGDVHGCFAELVLLLKKLGYDVDDNRDEPQATPPAGRTAVFVGDLVDRGPDSPAVLKLVMAMVQAGHALCVPGNHEDKLKRFLLGKQVTIKNGLEQTVAQLERESDEFKRRALSFIDGLVSHVVLDDGRLVVAHAGMKQAMQGRGSGAVRQFALYGETTGETDAFGLPVRYDWASEYRGSAMVVYGHTPVPEATWLNNTICIDTGCVFGGALTALRYPERELVDVPALAVHYAPAKPLAPALPVDTRLIDWRGSFPAHPSGSSLVDKTAKPVFSPRSIDVIDIDDVAGKRHITTRLQQTVTIRAENSAAALETMSRFAVDPQWLIYLPPTMSPSETCSDGPLLEHPREAFTYFKNNGVDEVICEEKHMGSRAVVVVCRDAEVGRRRFRAHDGRAGVVVTRTGRPFFNDRALEDALLGKLRAAVDASDLWRELDTDWLCLDAELLPWSAKAQELLRTQYAPVGTAATAALSSTVRALEAAAARGVDVQALLEQHRARADMIAGYDEAWHHYCWPVNGVDDLRLAPFHLLASEGKVHVDKDHLWHLQTLAHLAFERDGLVTTTKHITVRLDDEDSVAAGIGWWQNLVDSGSEGMVVKPLQWNVRGNRGLVQPALKCRGPEYLRLIYGPEYTTPAYLERLRQRGVGTKRSLALREYVLGLEALHRFVDREPLYRVHECVFGVLALESEPVDPRL